MNTDFRPTRGTQPWSNAVGPEGDPLSPVPNIGRRGPGGDMIPEYTTYRKGGPKIPGRPDFGRSRGRSIFGPGPVPIQPQFRTGGPGVGPEDVTGIVGRRAMAGPPDLRPTGSGIIYRQGPRQNYDRMSRFSGSQGRSPWRGFDGGQDMTKTSVGSYVLGMISVGALFFAIGYGLQKGKEKA